MMTALCVVAMVPYVVAVVKVVTVIQLTQRMWTWISPTSVLITMRKKRLDVSSASSESIRLGRDSVYLERKR
jgi:hypothetical protein